MNQMEIVNKLENAIKNGYIQVYLQPIYRTLTNDICEFEALARWNDPQEGMLAPIKFIPALEESNQIYKLDIFMLNEICRLIRQRMDCDQMMLPVSLNFSRKDFQMCDMFAEVNRAVEVYHIPKDMLQIEITESALLEDTKKIIDLAGKFRLSGFEVWMDDFGEGYSSLNMLASCDFDVIKLDMGFMRNFNEKTKVVLANVVRMAKQLGMKTLSEGVETEEQYRFLTGIGCERVQGYYFSKPLAADDAIAFMEHHSRHRENRAIAKYYDKIGQVEFTTDRSLIIYELVDNNIKILYANKEVMEEVTSTGIQTIEELERLFNDDMAPLSVHFREYLKKIEDIDQFHQYDYTAWNYYIRMRVKKIANNGNRMAFQTEAVNFNNEKNYNQLNAMPEHAFYEFTNECMIGVDEIDNEHRHFFVLANEAVDAVNNTTVVDDRAKNIIREIKKYAHTHFQHEEAYMREINDPILTKQIMQHQQFIDIANAIDESSFTKEEYIETINFIVHWLYKHIIGSDTLIGKSE